MVAIVVFTGRFLYRNTLSGFMIHLGSNKDLMSFITPSPVGPISSGSRACLPHPMPCSPVQVPPIAKARLGSQKTTHPVDKNTTLETFNIATRTLTSPGAFRLATRSPILFVGEILPLATNRKRSVFLFCFVFFFFLLDFYFLK